MAASMRQDVWNGLAGFGNIGGIILAKKRGQRRRNLVLCYRLNVGSLSHRGSVGAEKCDPDVFGIRNFLAVILPFVGRFSAPVVGRKDERRIAAIFRHGLGLLPKRSHVGVGAVGGVEIVDVASRVGPVVCLAQ